MNDTDKMVADALRGSWVHRFLPQSVWPYAQLARWERPIGWKLLMWPCWWSATMAMANMTQLPVMGGMGLDLDVGIAGIVEMGPDQGDQFGRRQARAEEGHAPAVAGRRGGRQHRAEIVHLEGRCADHDTRCVVGNEREIGHPVEHATDDGGGQVPVGRRECAFVPARADGEQQWAEHAIEDLVRWQAQRRSAQDRFEGRGIEFFRGGQGAGKKGGRDRFIRIGRIRRGEVRRIGGRQRAQFGFRKSGDLADLASCRHGLG